MSLRLGTRGSALALAQARWVAARLGGAELVTVTTSGDRGAGPEDKSRWVTELEAALLAGDIDFAVHSAKDVPARLPEGLVIAAVPEREAAADALCGAASLSELTAGARVGTSSPRRAAQLRAARPDLEVVALRGNVDTRLRKLGDGECDAAVLARAGLARLGRLEAVGGELDWVPAPGQGALALEGRSGDIRVAGLNHPAARVAVEAERALVRELGATCNTPLGAHAELVGDGGGPPRGRAALRLRAWLGLPDGSAWLADELLGEPIAPETLGREVGRRMRAAGAAELLAEAEAMAS